MAKIALITGGASGMGLAVAEALVQRPDWEVHILDLNSAAGSEAEKAYQNITFHRTDVGDYTSLAGSFQSAFRSKGKLDFVFANAGIIERKNFYATHPTSGDDPPVELDQSSIDVDLKGMTATAYLALHYFRQSPHKGQGTSMIINSSCGGLYPSYYSPLYTAAKFGAVGFTKAIAGNFRLDGIRVNVLCPGIVQTNLLDKKGWSGFPAELFTDVSDIASIVCKLIDGADITDSKGRTVTGDKLYGQVVEVNIGKFYFRD